MPRSSGLGQSNLRCNMFLMQDPWHFADAKAMNEESVTPKGGPMGT
jgi:hypothetical protein